MRVVAGVALFSVSVLAAATMAVRAGVANDGRVPDDPDLPIRTSRFDDGLMAAMSYDPPTVQASAGGLSMPSLSLPSLQALGGRPEFQIALRQPSAVGPAAIAPMPSAYRPIDDAAGEVKEILLRIGPKEEDRNKGRWFVFAAGSGEAFGLNLIRDGGKGRLRRAGWSVEKLAEFGKAQVGVGWRRGSRQISLAASRREIGAYGITQEDTVVGVTVSIKP